MNDPVGAVQAPGPSEAANGSSTRLHEHLGPSVSWTMPTRLLGAVRPSRSAPLGT